MLVPLTNRAELRDAFVSFANQLKRNAKPLKRYVGWQGGGGYHTLYWRRKENIWTLLEPKEIENRYWCCFGIGQPPEQGSQSIICEINPPIKGVDRRLAGIVLKDDSGSLYLAHSGKVGGGRKGIGKNSFLAYWRGENVADVVWPDGGIRSAIVIGRFGGKRLPVQIARFVHEVAKFKKQALTQSSSISTPQTRSKFSPEFSGTRKGYEIRGRIEASCDHGFIIDELVKELSKRKLRYANDRHRDLFVLAKNSRVRCLFEVKTDNSSTNTYQGIGQALYHTALHTPKPSPILVMPGIPNKRTEKVLSRLGIELVSYTWNGSRPKFRGLDRATRR